MVQFFYPKVEGFTMNIICRECNIEKPLSAEFFEQRTDNGLYRHICISCLRASQREAYKARHKDKIEAKATKIAEEDKLFSEGKYTCQHCNQIMSLKQFNKHALGRLGLDSTCRNCKIHLKEKRFKESGSLRTCRKCGVKANTVDELSLFVKSKNGKFGRFNFCKSCHSTSESNKLHNNALIRRVGKFGITVDTYHSMIESQNNCCAICNKHKDDFTGRGNSFHIDHCHESGKVRGLLCSNCNTGLGQFKDNINSMKSAIQYLIKNIKNV